MQKPQQQLFVKFNIFLNDCHQIYIDEIVAAWSGKYETSNIKYYLYRPGYLYWSLSPYCANTIYYFNDNIFIVYSGGNLSNTHAYARGAVVPIINLTYEYANTLIDDGTLENPYQTV